MASLTRGVPTSPGTRGHHTTAASTLPCEQTDAFENIAVGNERGANSVDMWGPLVTPKNLHVATVPFYAYTFSFKCLGDVCLNISTKSDRTCRKLFGLAQLCKRQTLSEMPSIFIKEKQ